MSVSTSNAVTNQASAIIERRHFVINGHHTTIGLEPLYWSTMENLTRGDWRHWVNDRISNKPADVGRASWLRQSVLMVMTNG